MKKHLKIIIKAILLSASACGTITEDFPSAITPSQSMAENSEHGLVFSSFNPTDDSEHASDPNRIFHAADLNSVFANHQFELACETEVSIYYVKQFTDVAWIRRSVVYVSDKEYKDWMPLRGRPDCMHNDENCNAWLEGYVYSKIWLYGNHIYYVHCDNYDPELWRMNLDGSEHEMLLVLSRPDPNSDGASSWSWTFHNKYLIANYRKEEGLNGYETTTYVVDLSARKLEQRKLDAYLETGEKTYVGYCVAGKDNIVYHWQSKNVEISDPVSGETRTKAITSLYKTDLETGATSKLCILPFQPFFGDSSLEGDLLYFCESTDENIILTVNTETGELTTVNTAELYSVCWVTPYHGYIFGTIDRKSSAPDGTPFENLGTFIYDLSGELVCSIPYESYSADIYILFALGDRLFGVERTDDREAVTSLFPTWYLDLSEMGTEVFGWHRWSEE